MFDAGRGVVKPMVRAGVPLAFVNPVLITHHHFDHIGDLYDVALEPGCTAARRRCASRAPGDAAHRRYSLTQVYDKDWQWRALGEPSFGGWRPVMAEDVAPGLVLDTGRIGR